MASQAVMKGTLLKLLAKRKVFHPRRLRPAGRLAVLRPAFLTSSRTRRAWSARGTPAPSRSATLDTPHLAVQSPPERRRSAAGPGSRRPEHAPAIERLDARIRERPGRTRFPERPGSSRLRGICKADSLKERYGAASGSPRPGVERGRRTSNTTRRSEAQPRQEDTS